MTTHTKRLRGLVEAKLDEHWLTWSQNHPHLAAAIGRTRLIDLAVDRLRDDPAFIQAMQQASIDQHVLDRSSRLHQLIEEWTRRVLFN
ncbi:MAG: hypothetical protein AAGA25_00360 [Planctomycetota bacterium]